MSELTKRMLGLPASEPMEHTDAEAALLHRSRPPARTQVSLACTTPY